MDEKLAIQIPSDPAVVANILDKSATDWFEVLKFLTDQADEQGVVFDAQEVTRRLASKYAEPA
jgi:mannitol/fructose-specific phosphotransferase system IIA component (Ntr-type)